MPYNAERLLKSLEAFETLFPRKKIPSYAKVSKDVWEELKRHSHMIVRGNPTFGGFTAYVDERLPSNTSKIYNLDGEEINV